MVDLARKVKEVTKEIEGLQEMLWREHQDHLASQEKEDLKAWMVLLDYLENRGSLV